jgi:transcriptional regulator with XRE-family HTH domain
MHGGRFIKEARIRGGLTQSELAEALGTSQPVIARWETGRSEPSFRRVVAAVRAAGFELGVRILTADPEDLRLMKENLALTPSERLDRLTRRAAESGG